MPSTAFILLGILLVIALFISSDVSARDLAQQNGEETKETGVVAYNAKYSGEGGKFGVHPSSDHDVYGRGGRGDHGGYGRGGRGDHGGRRDRWDHGGGRDRRDRGGRRGGRRDGGRGGRHRERRCRYRCCHGYYGRGCKRCCYYTDEAFDAEPETKPHT